MDGVAQIHDPVRFVQHHETPWFFWARFPFNDNIKNYIQSIPGSFWDNTMRAWLVPIESLYSIAEVAANEGYEIDMANIKYDFEILEKESDV